MIVTIGHRVRRTARVSLPAAAAALAVVLLTACAGAAGQGKGPGPGSTHTGAADPASAQGNGGRGKAGGPSGSGSVTSGRYVALGDSFTSAPLVSDLGGLPAGCLRSAKDYPTLVAAALHIPTSAFSDVSCYGASTADVIGRQEVLGKHIPSQLDALSAADSLVTLQVGGDDIRVSHIAFTCGTLSLTDPLGSPCTRHYTAGGTDQLARAVAQTGPKVAAVLGAIHQRAPAARVLLVGYPDILPTSGNGCWPDVPIARGDVPYLRGVEAKLNSMLAAEAAAGDATFVNTYTPSIGHDACQHAGVKWIEGLIPTSLGVPFHPNAAGEQAMAREIVATIR